MKETKAKAFMFTCIGILAICIAVQVTIPATAQSPEPPTVAAAFQTEQGNYQVYMSNGDVHTSGGTNTVDWWYSTNAFEIENPTGNSSESLGDVKRSFR